MIMNIWSNLILATILIVKIDSKDVIDIFTNFCDVDPETLNLTNDRLEMYNFYQSNCPSNETNSDNDSGRQRSFTSTTWASNVIDAINGYGCWCYFGDDSLSGKGSTINDMDVICKVLQDGYSCIISDGEDDGESCEDPWDQDYTSATGFPFSSLSSDNMETAILEACEDANSDSDCSARVCAVQGYFVLSIFELFLSGSSLDTSYKHSFGNMDTDTDCSHTDAGTSGQDKMCCGTYPLRFGHKDGNGDKSCCSYHVYDNTGDLACCEDTRVYDTTKVNCCSDGTVGVNC